jgi:hypothetical protein
MKHQLFKYAWPKHEDNNKCVNRSSVYFVTIEISEYNDNRERIYRNANGQ